MAPCTFRRSLLQQTACSFVGEAAYGVINIISASRSIGSRREDGSRWSLGEMVLQDIEGTVAPISFVASTLFPYAALHLQSHLEAHFSHAAMQQVVALYRKQVCAISRSLALYREPVSAVRQKSMHKVNIRRGILALQPRDWGLGICRRRDGCEM